MWTYPHFPPPPASPPKTHQFAQPTPLQSHPFAPTAPFPEPPSFPPPALSPQPPCFPPPPSVQKPERRTCRHCRKSFAHSSSLSRHLKTHFGHSVACEICGDEFARQDTLKTHIKNKHSNIRGGCQIHDQSYVSESGFYKRQRNANHITVSPERHIPHLRPVPPLLDSPSHLIQKLVAENHALKTQVRRLHNMPTGERRPKDTAFDQRTLRQRRVRIISHTQQVHGISPTDDLGTAMLLIDAVDVLLKGKSRKQLREFETMIPGTKLAKVLKRETH